MEVLIFGGTGFVGQHIAHALEKNGDEVWVVSRATKPMSYGKLKLYKSNLIKSLLEEMHQDYAIINLAGQSINSGRWTTSRKQQILDSRVDLTTNIARAIREVEHKPCVLINASAIGFYGYSDSKSFTENDSNGEGFLAKVTRSWELAAEQASDCTRVVTIRLGVVLGKVGGALPRIVAPYQWFVGGKVGSGQQKVSWIHIKDVCGIIAHCIENEQIKGPVNVTAPHPVSMDEFGKEIGRVLNRPHWLPVPALALQLLLGEMAEIVLKGQHVLPHKLLTTGYSFQFHSLSSALQDLYK